MPLGHSRAVCLAAAFETAHAIGCEPIGLTGNRSEKGKSEIPKSMNAIKVIVKLTIIDGVAEKSTLAAPPIGKFSHARMGIV